MTLNETLGATGTAFMRGLATRPRVKRHAPHPAPPRTVAKEDHRQKLALKQWCECPACGKNFVGGAIVTDDPKYTTSYVWEDEDGHMGSHTGFRVLRRLFCDHCDQIVVWFQASNESGSKLGERLGRFGFQRGPKAIDQFLRQHPEAAGVSQ